MKHRILTVTLELPIRAMTEEEWEEAMDGAICIDPEEDDGPDREETLDEVAPNDFREAISAALNSVNNPEMFAGTGLFVHTEDAKILAVEWKEGATT